MNPKIKLIALAFLIAALIGLSFVVGYYAGFRAKATSENELALEASVAMYNSYGQNRAEAIKPFLVVEILGHDRSLHMLKDAPLSYFFYSLAHDRQPNAEKLLPQADDLISKDDLIHRVPAAVTE